ncbi:MAG: LolA family protein [Desulfobacterales bacterium]
MKKVLSFILIAVIWISGGTLAASAAAEGDVDAVLDRVEERYSGKAFTAGFVQVSTVKAMDITDEAEGTLYVEYPGKMRWAYDYPERLFFITNGDTVWIWKPEDNQVSVGKATDILGDSKGATFLSDIGLIRKRFTVSLEPSDTEDAYPLKLEPKQENVDISAVYLTVSKTDYNVSEVMTTNAYEDETRIFFKDFSFQPDFPEDLFQFDIPEGADVLEYSP